MGRAVLVGGIQMEMNSKQIARALVIKCLRYEQEIDAKQNRTDAEERHLNFLRAFITSSISDTDDGGAHVEES